MEKVVSNLSLDSLEYHLRFVFTKLNLYKSRKLWTSIVEEFSTMK